MGLLRKLFRNKTAKSAQEKHWEFEREEKEKRAAELIIANKELAYQNEEKEQRALELIIANKELAFQNELKEKRAAELVLANKELAFQNEQKEKRAAELIIANKELAFQNEQKEKRAAELALANIELAYQNDQKEQRAAELIIANQELAFQNEQKEKRAAELAVAVKDLEAFAFVSSHHLQEPLRKIRSFVDRLLDRETTNLSEKGQYDLRRIDIATGRISQLISDVYTYSRINVLEPHLESVSLNSIIDDAREAFGQVLQEKAGRIECGSLPEICVIASQFRQLLHQLVDNAIKFSRPGVPPCLFISAQIASGQNLSCTLLIPEATYYHIEVRDNGIGFDERYTERIFEIFQKLHTVEEFPGTGIGLAIVKKIMERHKGAITASSEPGKGATFHLYFPVLSAG